MNNYIIYETDENTTTLSPTEIAFVNCQILKFAQGNTPEEALDNFIANDPDILDSGFNEIQIVQIIGEKSFFLLEDYKKKSDKSITEFIT